MENMNNWLSGDIFRITMWFYFKFAKNRIQFDEENWMLPSEKKHKFTLIFENITCQPKLKLELHRGRIHFQKYNILENNKVIEK